MLTFDNILINADRVCLNIQIALDPFLIYQTGHMQVQL